MERIKDALGTAILFIAWCCVNFWPLIVVGTVIITAIIFLLSN